MISAKDISIILPAKNEADTLQHLLPELRALAPNAEIIVVDDGSSDDTSLLAHRYDARLVRHRYSMGNGAAIKSGIRAATRELVVCMDSDGQHQPKDMVRLIEAMGDDVDMVVGARSGGSQASIWRSIANRAYNRLAGWVVGHRIDDLTSGMRAVRRERALEFLYLLPNGFSYPTTLTMAFFRAGYQTIYLPIDAKARKGTSHISPLRDGIRFLLIIFKVGTLYSPLKIFFPMSFVMFMMGLGYYIFTYVTEGRFTNMGALLLLSAIMIFLMGLVSEQITALMYKRR